MAIRPVVCADGTIRPLEAGERIDPKALGLFKAIRAKSDQVRVVANPDGSVTIDRVCCVAPTPPPPPKRKTDVVIEKSISTDVYGGTGSVLVTTTVRNVSDVRAENVKVRETFTGMDFDSQPSVSRGSYDDNGHVWTIGALDPQQVETARLVFSARNATSVESVGVVSTTTPETTLANNEARVGEVFTQASCADEVHMYPPCLPPMLMPDTSLNMGISYSPQDRGCCSGRPGTAEKIKVEVTAFIVNYGGTGPNPNTATTEMLLEYFGEEGCSGNAQVDLWADVFAQMVDYPELLTYVQNGNVKLQVVLTREDGSEFADKGYNNPVLQICADTGPL